MKNKFRDKYVPVSYFDRLLNDWHRSTQDAKFAKEYVAQFVSFSFVAVSSAQKVTL